MIFKILGPTKALHRMGGNGMAMRSVLTALCILLRGVNPTLAQAYLKPWSCRFTLHVKLDAKFSCNSNQTWLAWKTEELCCGSNDGCFKELCFLGSACPCTFDHIFRLCTVKHRMEANSKGNCNEIRIQCRVMVHLTSWHTDRTLSWKTYSFNVKLNNAPLPPINGLMGILGRYDEHKDELVIRGPARQGCRWRYDETSESQPCSSEMLGHSCSHF